MPHVESFLPIVNDRVRVLILGSMPGQASLTADQYYAHPRNSFWRIMGDILVFDFTASYEYRLEQLLKNRIGLWDVAHHCKREGSLDSNIEMSSVKPNLIHDLYKDSVELSAILFNGKKAAELYERHCNSVIPESGEIQYYTLPSTSPANAMLSYSDKLELWRSALCQFL